MVRMSVAGYNEYYRKRTLEKSLKVYDRLVKEQEEGKLINRPRDRQKEERSIAKRNKKHRWATNWWVHCTYHYSTHSTQ